MRQFGRDPLSQSELANLPLVIQSLAMRKHLLVIAAVVSLSALAQPAPEPDSPQKTSGMLNGRAWNTMSRADQLFYITGLREGLSFILRAKYSEGLPPNEIFAAKFSTGEIVGETEPTVLAHRKSQDTNHSRIRTYSNEVDWKTFECGT
jgi:hypothetical protein